MYFDLTEEQKQIRDSLDALLRDHINGTGIVRQIDEGITHDQALWQKLVEMGLTAILVSEADGGLGMDLLTLSVIADSLGYSGAMTALIFHNIATYVVAEIGSPEQKAAHLPALISGERIATLALSEGAQHWLPEQWQIGGSTLTGTKEHVVAAKEAQLFVVGLKGGSFGLVERTGPGVSVESVLTVDATRSLGTLQLENAAYAPLNGDAGFSSRLLDALRVLLAADAYGATRRCLEMAVDYAKTRHQFDRPIGSFQALKHQLANMVVDHEPCRALYWYAAHAWDKIPKDAQIAPARAKAHITQISVKAARATVEAHGGIGYTWEYPLHVWLKRTMFDYAYLGSPFTERERVATLVGW